MSERDCKLRKAVTFQEHSLHSIYIYIPSPLHQYTHPFFFSRHQSIISPTALLTSLRTGQDKTYSLSIGRRRRGRPRGGEAETEEDERVKAPLPHFPLRQGPSNERGGGREYMSLLASLSLSTDPYNKKDRLVVSLASSSPLH